MSKRELEQDYKMELSKLKLQERDLRAQKAKLQKRADCNEIQIVNYKNTKNQSNGARKFEQKPATIISGNKSAETNRIVVRILSVIGVLTIFLDWLGTDAFSNIAYMLFDKDSANLYQCIQFFAELMNYEEISEQIGGSVMLAILLLIAVVIIPVFYGIVLWRSFADKEEGSFVNAAIYGMAISAIWIVGLYLLNAMANSAVEEYSYGFVSSSYVYLRPAWGAYVTFLVSVGGFAWVKYSGNSKASSIGRIRIPVMTYDPVLMVRPLELSVSVEEKESGITVGIIEKNYMDEKLEWIEADIWLTMGNGGEIVLPTRRFTRKSMNFDGYNFESFFEGYQADLTTITSGKVFIHEIQAGGENVKGSGYYKEITMSESKLQELRNRFGSDVVENPLEKKGVCYCGNPIMPGREKCPVCDTKYDTIK